MSSSFKTISNKELEQEILRLNLIYMDCITWDHHKDRDCKFYITQKFEYGHTIVYYVEHPGYINEYEEYEEFKTWRGAAEFLAVLIRGYIAELLEGYKEAKIDDVNIYGYSERDVKIMTDIYEQYKDEFNV